MDKNEIIHKLMQAIGSVEQGNMSALDLFPDFYELEKSIKELNSQLKSYVVEELDHYDKKEAVRKGDYEISTRSTTRHSYTHDESWSSIKQTLSNREALMKKAYAMSLKGQTLTDMETGEVITPSEAKTSTAVVAKFVGGFTL